MFMEIKQAIQDFTGLNLKKLFKFVMHTKHVCIPPSTLFGVLFLVTDQQMFCSIPKLFPNL